MISVDLAAAPFVVEPGATAVTRVFGDGQKLIAVALRYPSPIDGRSIDPIGFRVDGRTVSGVYTSTSVDPADRSTTGRFVVIALSPDDAEAALREVSAPPAAATAGNDPGASGGPPHFPAPRFRLAHAIVRSIGPMTTVGGVRLPARAEALPTSAVVDLVVNEFRVFTFRSSRTGDVLHYNLFVPRSYDRSRRYPLVLFMHDASVVGPDPSATLRQGLGAVVWASRADQARNPCFVVAPQYGQVVVNDQSEATSLLDTTADLVRELVREHAVDPRRIYATGQSMGAMMSIALNIRYPGVFAASYIVAGQWDPTKVAPLARDRLWITVSQGDLKAYPGENAITAQLELLGARVSRAVWDGRADPEQIAAAAASLLAAGNPINYVALRAGTVVPPDQPDNGGTNHVNTWRIAYGFREVREWLFDQHL